MTGLAESLLTVKALSPLGEACVEAIWTVSSYPTGRVSLGLTRNQRLVVTPLPATTTITPAVSIFFRRLQDRHPQVLYKPLFTCSAAATTFSLSPPLKLAQTLSTLLGPDRFWLNADPEMVAIVLMGTAGPKVNKGKGKEGHPTTGVVKLGRYAMVVELLKALQIAIRPGQVNSRLRSFIDRLESRVAIMLETEVRDSHRIPSLVDTDEPQEKSGRLPADYRALVCRLLYSMRKLSGSVKR